MKKLKTTIQGSLLHVFPVEVVFGGNVVENGSGLHQLHPINFNHWHLLKQQVVTWEQKPRVRSALSPFPHPSKNALLNGATALRNSVKLFQLHSGVLIWP